MKIFKNIRRNIKLTAIFNHTFWWLLLILYEQFTIYATTNKFSAVLPFLFYYSCNIGLFYCQVGLLNSTLQKRQRNYFKLLILFLIEAAIFLAIKVAADIVLTNFSQASYYKYKIIKAMATLDLLRNFYFVAFGTLYWAINNFNRYQKKDDAAEIGRLKAANENADLEIRLAKSLNAYLQQQINPHLLFNSLDFIHSSVYKFSHVAAENIILLSDILRYSLEETDTNGKITLMKEAEQVENLIKINRFRFDYPLNLSYIVEGELFSHKIIPLVLMTLTENLFKHGDLRSKPAVIRLSVTENGELKFYTSNHKRPLAPVKRVKSIGIENIKIRLNYTYGTGYRLAVNETDDIYESELTLNL